MPYRQDIKNYPDSVKRVCDVAIKILNPLRIIIFGSWARADHKPTSDFDLAFDLAKDKERQWTRFVVEMTDDSPTLHELDLVRLDQIDDDFKQKILTEGKVLYES